MDVHPSRKTKLIIVAKEDKREIFEEAKVYLEKLAYASEIIINEAKDELAANAVPIVVDIGQIYIPLEDLVDFKSELDRLEKEKAKLEGELNRVNGKLSNPNFVEKAPAAIVKAEEEKKAKYEDMMASVLEQIDKIRKMME
jgi:valyl-tRNA synthetase